MAFQELPLWPLAALGAKFTSLKTASFDIGEFRIREVKGAPPFCRSRERLSPDGQPTNLHFGGAPEVNLAVFSDYAPDIGALQVNLENSADSKAWVPLGESRRRVPGAHRRPHAREAARRGAPPLRAGAHQHRRYERPHPVHVLPPRDREGRAVRLAAGEMNHA